MYIGCVGWDASGESCRRHRYVGMRCSVGDVRSDFLVTRLDTARAARRFRRWNCKSDLGS